MIMSFAAVICLLAVAAASGLRCKDENGDDVDWYYAYKLPRNKFSSNAMVRQGLAYLYLSSKSPNTEWTLGEYAITDEDSVLGKTLAPLYDPARTPRVFHAMYNNYPPAGKADRDAGFAKGLVFGMKNATVWLLHSIPAFPLPVQRKSHLFRSWDNPNVKSVAINKYEFPEEELSMGHMALCLSLPRSNENHEEIRKHLKPMKPWVYSSRASDSALVKDMQRGFPDDRDGADEKFVGLYESNVTTAEGKVFALYGKTKSALGDIYEAVSQSRGGVSLYVESSTILPDEPLNSVCLSKYQIENVRVFRVPLGKKRKGIFMSFMDRSKWAVSQIPGLICVGDLDRSEKHMGHAGGLACTKDAKIWKRFNEAVVVRQMC